MMTPNRDQVRWWDPARLFSRGALLLGGAAVVSGLGGMSRRAAANDAAPLPTVAEIGREMGDLNSQLANVRGEAEVLRLQLERSSAILAYSSQYQVPADLATAIYDIALSEGIDPALGFRLVRVESNFKFGARSHADAIGYTQIQVATARYYQAGITEQELYDRDTNLRLGFRFLHDLLGRFDNNLPHALLAYNRGPTRVAGILSQGGDPANGYARAVLKGDPRAAQLPQPLP